MVTLSRQYCLVPSSANKIEDQQHDILPHKMSEITYAMFSWRLCLYACGVQSLIQKKSRYGDNKRDIPATLMFPISSEQNTTSIRNMRGPYIKEIYCRNATWLPSRYRDICTYTLQYRDTDISAHTHSNIGIQIYLHTQCNIGTQIYMQIHCNIGIHT